MSLRQHVTPRQRYLESIILGTISPYTPEELEEAREYAAKMGILMDDEADEPPPAKATALSGYGAPLPEPPEQGSLSKSIALYRLMQERKPRK